MDSCCGFCFSLGLGCPSYFRGCWYYWTGVAKELNTLQLRYNQERGIECVTAIVGYLLRDDWKSARNIFENEGDKIRQYPDVEKYLKRLFNF